MYQIARMVIGCMQERRLDSCWDDVGKKEAPFES